MKGELKLYQQLDLILAYLNNANRLFKEDIFIEFKKTIQISNNDIKIILDKLVSEKLVKEETGRKETTFPEYPLQVIEIDEEIYTITWEGKYFLELGGFTHKFKREKSKIRLINTERGFLFFVTAVGLLYTIIEIIKFFR
jgi:hypothetical protein